VERQRRAADPATDPPMLGYLSFDDSWRVRAACASNPKLPEVVLRRLAADSHSRVRKAAARHPSLPPDLVKVLAADPSPVVRDRIAIRGSIAVDPLLCATFAGSPHVDLRRLAAGSEVTPQASLAKLGSDPDVGVRMVLAANPAVGDRVAEQLACDGDEAVRALVGRRRRLTGLVVNRLIGDPATTVRAAVAGNPACPRPALRTLAKRGEPQVLRSLAGNTGVGALLLHRLASRRWDLARVVAANPACPPLLLRSLSTSPFESVRMAVAARASAPPSLLARMARGHPAVRLLAAANPGLASEDVARLLLDADPYVRTAAAGNPAAPPAALARLAEAMAAPAWTLRAIAANPACPPELSDQLLTWLALGGAGAADPTFDPVACSGHPGEPGTNIFEWYRQEAAKSSAPCRHPLWRVRAATPSSRDKTPYAWLAAMARDMRPEVRQVAARYPGLPAGVLKELTGDAVSSVADQAAASLKRKPQPRGAKRVPRGVSVAVIASVLLFAVRLAASQSSPQTPDFTKLTLPDVGPLPTATPGAAQPLPGGGTLIAGMLDSLGVPYITVNTGEKGLTVTVPAPTLDGPSASDGYRISSFSAHQFVLLPGSAGETVTVTAKPDDGNPVKVTVHIPAAGS